MTRNRPTGLIVDTSVGRAAGPAGATHPTSKNCRDFLLAVLNSHAEAVFTAELNTEWRKHVVGYGLEWKRTMVAKKRAAFPADTRDAALRAAIAAADCVQRERDAMLKDAHLIEGTAAAAAPVAALDDTVRTLFRTLAATVATVRAVCWVNPNRSAEDALSWVGAGMPCRGRRLGDPAAPTLPTE